MPKIFLCFFISLERYLVGKISEGNFSASFQNSSHYGSCNFDGEGRMAKDVLHEFVVVGKPNTWRTGFWKIIFLSAAVDLVRAKNTTLKMENLKSCQDFEAGTKPTIVFM